MRANAGFTVGVFGGMACVWNGSFMSQRYVDGWFQGLSGYGGWDEAVCAWLLVPVPKTKRRLM